ncbi:MAG: DUF222 domain-containing protein [Cumulibacter sp.]
MDVDGDESVQAELDPYRFVPYEARAGADSSAQGARCLAVAEEFSEEIAAALERLHDGLDALIDIGQRGDFGALDPRCLLRLASEFEAFRSRSILIDNHVVEAAGEDPSFATFTGEKRVARGLARSLRIGIAEANARERRAKRLLTRNGFSAGEKPPALPSLASAVAAGAVTTGQVDEILTAMRRINAIPAIDPSLSEQAEEVLVRHADALGPAELKVASEKLDQILLPDGAGPEPAICAARRGLRIGSQRHDGLYEINGLLEPSVKAQLEAVLSPLSAPQPSEAGATDDRSPDQRRHDALGDAARRLLELAGVPASGGTAATVHINVDLDAILDALGIARGEADSESAVDFMSRHDPRSAVRRHVGRVAGGDRITLHDFVRLADEAMLVPTWTTNIGGVVAFGRSRRVATENQTHALIARDGGCSFPGCDAPPDWCQRHHVVEWWRGGGTDVDNLTLVCGHHHREFERSGWRVDMNDGLPWWTPPQWVDPEQRPKLNARIKIPDQRQIEDVALKARIVGRQEQKCADSFGRQELGDGEGLDPVDDLVTLLIAHVVDPHRREQFHHELVDLLNSYLAGDQRITGPATDDRRSPLPTSVA